MKYIDSLKYLSKDPISQLFQYSIYKNDYKFVIKHPACEGVIDKLLNYQKKTNFLYDHLLSNLDNYIIEPSKYLNFIRESIMLKYSENDISRIYADEFCGLNINLNRLNFIFSGGEHKKCLKEFTELKSLEMVLPSYIQNSIFLNSEEFIFRSQELCKQFGLAGIIVPKILQTEEFFINLEKNILFLSNIMLIQSQKFGKLEIIILIDDKDYSGLSVDIYQNIEKLILSDNKIILKINTDAFQYNNFIHMPNEKISIFTEHISKKIKNKI